MNERKEEKVTDQIRDLEEKLMALYPSFKEYKNLEEQLKSTLKETYEQDETLTYKGITLKWNAKAQVFKNPDLTEKELIAHLKSKGLSVSAKGSRLTQLKTVSTIKAMLDLTDQLDDLVDFVGVKTPVVTIKDK